MGTSKKKREGDEAREKGPTTSRQKKKRDFGGLPIKIPRVTAHPLPTGGPIKKKIRALRGRQTPQGFQKGSWGTQPAIELNHPNVTWKGTSLPATRLALRRKKRSTRRGGSGRKTKKEGIERGTTNTGIPGIRPSAQKSVGKEGRKCAVNKTGVRMATKDDRKSNKGAGRTGRNPTQLGEGRAPGGGADQLTRIGKDLS